MFTWWSDQGLSNISSPLELGVLLPSGAARLREPKQRCHPLLYFSCILLSFYSSSWLEWILLYLLVREAKRVFAQVHPTLRVSCSKIKMWGEWHHLYRINDFFLPLLYVSFNFSCVWLQGYSESLWSLFLIMPSFKGP